MPIVNKVLRENQDLLTEKDNIFNGNAISNIIDTAVEMTCDILYRTIISENAYKLNLHAANIEKSRDLVFDDYINTTLNDLNTVSDFCLEYQALVNYTIKRVHIINFMLLSTQRIDKKVAINNKKRWYRHGDD